MTNEKLYFEICEMLKCYEAETGRADGSLEKILSDSRKLEALSYFTACPNIYASAARIILDIREKMDKKANSTGRVNVCKRLVKSIDGQGRTEMGGILPIDGRFCILDGFRAFRFSSDLPSIRRAKYPFDYGKLFSSFNRFSETLPPVSRAEIKVFIAKTGQTRTKCSEAFTPAEWPQWFAVNPFYLLDVLDAIPDAVFYLPAKYNAPLFFADDSGNDGILCPVNTASARAAWGKYQDEKRGKIA